MIFFEYNKRYVLYLANLNKITESEFEVAADDPWFIIIYLIIAVACPGGVLWVLKHPAHADPEKKKEEKKKKEKERKKEKEKEKERKPMITKNIWAPSYPR